MSAGDPAEQPPEAAEQGGAKLPVDPRTLVLALWQWRLWLCGALVTAAVLGVGTAMVVARRTYIADTVMLYQAPPLETPEAATTPSLFTLLSMVKLPENLATVRERLKIGADLSTLGKSVDVELEQKTTLVTIRAEWDSPRTAADIANEVRRVFLENQTKLRRRDSEVRVADLEARLAPVNESLAKAEKTLREFTAENRVIDLSQQARATLDELAAVNLLLEQAMIEKNSVDLQVSNTQKIVDELQAEAEKERRAAAAQTDQMSETNIRIQRLRESIMDDKESRENQALLEEARQAYERAQKSFKAGAISQEELDAATAKYRVIEARGVDTPQIAAWKKEMEELDKKVIPSAAPSGPTGTLLKDIMLRSFEIKLQQTTTNEKVQSLTEAKKRVEERLARMPDLTRTYAELTRAVETREREKRDLDVRLAEARRLLEASSLPFSLVAEAVPPIRSSSSNAKKVAAGIAVLLGGGSVLLILGIVLLDPRLRSSGEAAARTGHRPVLAELPHVPGVADLLPNPEPPEALREAVRALARQVRRAHPGRGVRILLTAAGHGEGTTTVALNLAAVLGRWDEEVVLLDVQLRSAAAEPPAEETAPLRPTEAARQAVREFLRRGLRAAPHPRGASLRDVVPGGATVGRGLGDVLAEPAARVAAELQGTALRGVRVLPRSGVAASPDLLATERFRALLAEASQAGTVVLLDGPAVLGTIDTENIAACVDAAVLVVRAGGPHAGAVREAAETLERAGVPVLGLVVNDVRPPFAVA